MSEIILPQGAEQEQPEEQEEELKYQATEVDEEVFICIYHLHMQPSEATSLDPDYRKWIIARFLAQKQMERELMERHRMMSQIMPNLRTDGK